LWDKIVPSCSAAWKELVSISACAERKTRRNRKKERLTEDNYQEKETKGFRKKNLNLKTKTKYNLNK
jgi:hypothetical protein